MKRVLLAVICTAVLSSFAACADSSKPLTPTLPTTAATVPADGTTLKASTTSPQSPINDTKLTIPTTTLVASPAAATFVPGAPLQYHFQLFNAANALVQEAVLGSPTLPVTTTLVDGQRYSWRVRAEYQDSVGPWSSAASFITRDPAIINDLLTDGRTVGHQIGGRFIPGQGWQSDSLVSGIDYDLPTPCIDCRLEFDATNFGGQEGFPYAKDLKWVSMGDANFFGGFSPFRDHIWKMHLVQRADYPGGVEIIWRNGGTDANGGDPGDHRIKLNDTPLRFSGSQVYHFQLDWGTLGYKVAINGIQIFEDGWDHWYEPANHRISLGCYPRAESIIGIIYRNVKLTKHEGTF